jgi:tight adherence protein B
VGGALRGDGLTLLLGATAGGLAALAVREIVLATPALAGWLRESLEPLRRAGREGYAPSAMERRRLGVIGAAGTLLFGVLLAGPGIGLVLAVAGPGLATWAVTRGRVRYHKKVEHALPEIANAIADSLSAGRSLRGSLVAATASLDGPAAVELSRLGAELELGTPTAEALVGLRERLRSPRVDSFAGALLSQRLAGGDLAGLLRRFAEGAAEQDRVAEDARSATAQARFTGLLVVAMPSGAALFAELVEPGFLAQLLSSPASTAMIALAGVLQLAGFAAIRRIARVGP